MGEPVRIVDLAHDLIQLSGFQADEIDIVFTGIRPGEKLYEELSVAEEQAEKTRHPKIFIGRTTAETLDQVASRLETLRRTVDAGALEEARRALRLLVPEYGAPQDGIAERSPSKRDDIGELPARGEQLVEA
jgi:FlaA1/EpsC-like NDP-sugar epimerase